MLLAAGCSKAVRKSRHLERANRYYEAELYDRAQIEFWNVLRLEPTNSLAIQRLGLAFYQQGEWVKAFAFLRKAAELDTNNVDIRLKLGMTYLAGRKLKEARDEAAFVLARQPGNEEALLLLSDATASPKEAQEVQRRLDELRPSAGKTAGYHVAMGIVRLRQQDLSAAEVAISQALALNPKSSAAHLAMGNLYALSNDLKRAGQSYKAAADLAPARSTVRLKYADFQMRIGDFESAKSILNEIIRKAPDYVPAWNRLSEIALAEKKFDDCAALVNRILLRDPENYEALLLRGRLKLAQGEPAKAVGELERMATAYARVPQVHFQLGLAHLLNRDLPKALGSLNQAIALDGNYTEAILVLAELNIRRGDPASAIALLTQLIKKNPQLGQAYVSLATAYQAAKNPDEALTVYRRMAEAFPKDPQPYLLMGLLGGQTKAEESRKAFEKAFELAPDRLDVLEQLVRLDVAEKRYQTAMNRLQVPLEKHPDAVGYKLLQAQVFLAQGNTNQAEAILVKTIALEPNSRGAYLMLAQIYVDTKKQAEALQSLRAVLAKTPKDVPALMMIGMIYEETGNFSAAQQAYEKVLEVNPRVYYALNNLACLYSERLGQLNKAYAMAYKAREIRPFDAIPADTLGWILYRRGDYALALSPLKDSTAQLNGSKEPLQTQAEIWFHLGMTHYMLGEEDPARLALQQALQLAQEFPGRAEASNRLALLNLEVNSAKPNLTTILEKALAEQPGDPVALSRLAAIYERDGLTDKAVKTYEKALKSNPNHVAAMVRLAQLYNERLHNPDKAMEWAQNAHNLAPQDPLISHTLGRLAYQTGDPKNYKWALSLLQESARKLPAESEVWYDLGWAYYNLGRLPEAEDAMQRALQTNPAFAHADGAKRFLALSAVYTVQTKASLGAAQVQETLKSEPDSIPAMLAAAVIYQQQGTMTAARQVYEKILNRNPLFAPANRSLAGLYAGHFGEFRKAYEAGMKAREVYRQDADLAKTLGVAAYQCGDYAQSAQFLKESAGKLTTDADVFYYLGLAHYRLKEKRECQQALQKALAMNLQPTSATEARRILTEWK